MTLLRLPRDVTITFEGAGILAHNVLRQFAGQTLRLREGFNRVDDNVAQHPALRGFVVHDDAVAPQSEPEIYEPQLEPAHPIAAVLATANEPDADAKAVDRAKAASKDADDARAKADADAASARKPAPTPPAAAAAPARPATPPAAPPAAR